ncbi:MAG: hypothetical protein HYR51_02395 [Candidatus Rokubacteria bacterium]|nr:hypothetical protein [Candidatus Rokubacteria bacterium]
MPARLSIALIIACVLALTGHVAGGHAHADLLDAGPLATHAAGDAHHDTGASCDALRSSDGAPVVPATCTLAVAVLVPPDRPVRSSAPPPALALPDSPLYLLHAALLI